MKFKSDLKKTILFVLVTIFLCVFFSYKLTSIPDGITGDEAAFGYNGILLSRTLHDENGRKLPIFVLSLDGKDWRQPVTQYFITAYFKVFGPSLFNLRLTSVIIATASIWLIYFLGRKLFDSNLGGIIAGVFLATIPIFMIQSHLGLDNIYPVIFTICWLIGLYQYRKTGKNVWLVFSGVSLGVGLYAYKAMRIFVPVWFIVSVFYIGEEFLKERSRDIFKKVVKPILFFSISILPFFAIIPHLEFLYAGAVLNNEEFVFPGIYNFFYPYLSIFDPSFLFIKGDNILTHSTGIHGMYLLASLPFFITGLISYWKKSSFWKLIIISFFIGPIMFGFMGSIHRASRLLAMIPLFSLISASGFLTLWKNKSKYLVLILSILFLVNYFSFLNYYFNQYAGATKNLFNDFSTKESAYKILKDEVSKDGKTAFIDKVVASREGATDLFAKSIYFEYPINLWNGDVKTLPQNAVLMTDNDNLLDMKKVGNTGNYYFYVKQ